MNTRDVVRSFTPSGLARRLSGGAARFAAGNPARRLSGGARRLCGGLLFAAVGVFAAGQAWGQTTFTVTGPASITEADVNQNHLFTVTRTGAALTSAATVTWTITHDATNGTEDADFVATSGTVSFAAGDDAQQFLITVVGDNLVDDPMGMDEGFGVQVSASGHMVGSAYDGAIAEDDIHFTITGPATITENDGMNSPDFTVTRTGAALTGSFDLQINARDVPLSNPRRGNAGLAFIAVSSNTVSFAAGDDSQTAQLRFQSQTFSLTDNLLGDRDYLVRLSITETNNPGNHTTSAPLPITVRDNDSRILISAGPRSFIETDSNQTNTSDLYVITIQGSQPTATLAVTWTINHGTAADATASPTVAADFVSTTGSANLDPAVGRVRFSITVVGDTTSESVENFNLTASATGYASGPGYDVVIYDDEMTSFAISGGPTGITETDADAATANYTITRTGAELTSMATVTWTINHAATGGTVAGDFSAVTGTVDFAIGADSETFTITVVGDTAAEDTKSFTLTASATGHNSGPAYGPITLADNDQATFTITAGPASLTETNTDTATTAYTITRTGTALTASTTVTWTVDHGTTSDADFSAVTGDVTFAAGDNSQTFTLTIVGDSLAEGPENFELTASATGHLSGMAHAVTIMDDDTVFTVTAGPSVLNETDADFTTTAYTITRTGAELTEASTTVTWTVDHGTTSAADFSAVTGDVTFAAGEDTQDFTLTIVGDSLGEGPESFELTASAAMHSSGTAYAVTIMDDDTSFAVTSPATVAETDTDATHTFTITRSGSELSAAATITWTVEHGTAADAADNPTVAADFSGTTTGTVDFAAGEDTKTFDITVVGDTDVEEDENFHISLSGPSVFDYAESDVTLTNDDTSFTLSATSAMVTETDSNFGATQACYAFTITRNGAELTAPVTAVTWTVNHGTSSNAADSPTADVDFHDNCGSSFQGSVPAGQAAFVAGADMMSITLGIDGDNDVEMVENFNITLSVTGHGVGGPLDAFIVDDDSHFALSGPTAPTETDADQALTYTITRTGAAVAATIRWDLEFGTAADNTDNPVSIADFVSGTFVGTGSVTFTVTDTTQDFTVPLAGDDEIDDGENFNLVLSGPTAHSYGAALNVRITDDDAQFTVTAGPTSLDETDADAASAAYTITRTGVAVAATVTWTINHGTVADATDSPTVAADFNMVTGTVTFAMADTTQTFTITVTGDNALEGDENFNLTASATGHTSGAGYDVALNDDEADFTLSLTAPADAVEEGSAPTWTVTYAADDGSSALAGETTVTVTVTGAAPTGTNLATGGYPDGVTSERTADPATDFASATATCTIPASTAHNAAVNCDLPMVMQDTLSERVEHYRAELSDALPGVTLGGQVFHTIAASDPINISFSSTTYSGTEGQPVTVRINITVDAGATVTVPSGLAELRLLFDDGATTYRFEQPEAGDTSIFSPTPVWESADGHIEFDVSGEADDSDAEADEVVTYRLLGSIAPIHLVVTDATATITFVDDDAESWTVRARGNGVQNEDVNENAPAIATPTTDDTTDNHADVMYFRFVNYGDLTTRGAVTVTYCLGGTATGGTAAQVAANPQAYDYTWPGNYDPESVTAAHADYTGSCTTGRGTFDIAVGMHPASRLGIELNDDTLNEGDETITITVVNAVETGYPTSLTGMGDGGNYISTRTIKDNDAISVSIANGGTDFDDATTGWQVQESLDAIFVVTLSTASAAAATIPYTIANLEAADYSSGSAPSPLSIEIAAGQTSGEIRFGLAEDDDGTMALQAAESFTVTLGAAPTVGTGGGSITRSSTSTEQSATQIIIPRQIARTLVLTRYTDNNYNTEATSSIAESTGSQPDLLYFAVSLTSGDNAFSAATAVTWTVTHGTTEDADFAAVTGSIMYPATVACATASDCRFTVGVVGDMLNEDSETFEIALTVADPAADNVTNEGTGSGTLTITDDDIFVIGGSAASATVNEGDNAVLNLTTGAIPTRDLTVNYTLGNTSATDDVDAILPGNTGADFMNPGSGSITFSGLTGATSGAITLPINADNLNEAAETFTVTITNSDIMNQYGTGSFATNALGNGITFTIAASDPITASIARMDSGTVQEGLSASFTVTLTGASAGSVAAITVPWTAALSGTGTTPDPASGTATIAVGMTSNTFSVRIPPADALTDDSPDQTLTVTLTGDDPATSDADEGPTAGAGGGEVARSSTAGEQSATAPVEFRTNLHSLAFTSPVTTLAEGAAATTYTLTRTGPDITSGTTLTITWTYAAGTPGPSDNDFMSGSAPTTGTFTYTGAATTATLDIATATDTNNEPDEQFTLTLSIASGDMSAATDEGGVALADPLTITIEDDDPVTVAIARASGSGAVDEDSGALSFTVTLAGGTRATGVSTIVPFAITGLDAGEFDITAPTGIAASETGGSVTIAQADSAATITVTLQDDSVNEAQETLALAGAAPGDAGLRLTGAGAGAVEYTSGGDMVSVMVDDTDDITVTLARAAGESGAVREGAAAGFTIALTDGSGGALTSTADICVGIGVEVRNQQTPANTAMSGADIAIGGFVTCADPPAAVDLAVANGAGTGSVTIAAGQSSAPLSVEARFDSVGEGTTNEQLQVSLGAIAATTESRGVVNASGDAATNTVNVEIQNVDAARSVSVSAGAAAVEEGGMVVFSIASVGAAVGEAFDLTWTITGVDAADVQPGLTGSVSFAANSDAMQTQMVTITAVDDTDAENDEAMSFTLTDPCAGVADEMCGTGGRPSGFSPTAPAIQVSTSPAMVTISQSDQPVTLGVTAPAALTEGTAANFTVSFAESVTTTADVTATYTITFPSAAPMATPPVFPAAAADFATLTGTATIPAGMSTANLPITAMDDAVNEAVESFIVTLSNAAGGGAIAAPVVSATPAATATIAESDPVTVQLSRTQGDPVVEGGAAEFTVSLVLTADTTTAATSGGAICVAFDTIVSMQQTPANDATSGADIAITDCDGMAVMVFPATGISQANGGVLIPAGSSSATLSVATRFDNIDEGATNERLQVTLNGATARAGAGTAGVSSVTAMSQLTAEIQNVNSLRTLAVVPPTMATVNEDSVTGVGETVPVEFGVTMTGRAPEGPVVVRWQLNIGSDGVIMPPGSGLGRSVEAFDVSSGQTGTVTFAASDTFPATRMVTVQVQQDALNEGAETLRLTLDPVAVSAGGQPLGPDVPGTIVVTPSADATIAPSDDITVFLNADTTGTVTSGDDARYTLSFGTTTVNGQVVPIVPTTEITVPLMVQVGGQTVTVPDVVVPAGQASAPVVIPDSMIDAASRGGATAMIMVTPQTPSGAPAGATARVASQTDVTEETTRRQGTDLPPVAVTPPALQVAGWTVALSQPSPEAPEGSAWSAVFTVDGDTARLAANGIQLDWSMTGRSVGGAEAAAAADFAASTATPPDYTCGANAEGVCSTFPQGRVTFTTGAANQRTVPINIRDDGVAEGDNPQGFRLTLDTIGGANQMQTVRAAGNADLDAAIPALRANLSVANATAAEGQNAEFVLTLSGFNGGTQTTQPITVVYALADGPAVGGARSGEDFTPPTTPAEVTTCPAEMICTVIPAGAEEGTTHRIAVPLVADGLLEPLETFMLTISDATGGGGNINLVAGAASTTPVPTGISATGTITDDADQTARRNRRVSALVTVLDRQTANLATDAISARLAGPRAGAQSAQLNLANRNLLGAADAPAGGAQNLGLALYGAAGHGAQPGGAAQLGAGAASQAGAAFGGLGAGLAGGANMGTRTALPTLSELLNGSSFTFSAAQGMLANLAQGVEVWGRGGYADLRGEPKGSGLSYDGKTVAAFVGADSHVSDKLLAGVAIGYAAGDMDFTDSVGSFEMTGELDSTMLTLHPYFGWKFSPQSNAWLVLGVGDGNMDLKENESGGVSRKLADGGDTAMRMFSAGMTRSQQVGETGDLKLRFGMTRVQSRVKAGVFDDNALLPKIRGRSMRLSAEAEAGRSIALENGLSLRPFGTLRFRFDRSSLAFADEPKVADQAIDWGAGLDASWAEMGLDARVAFDRQFNDTGHEEQRVVLDVNFAVPGAAGQGIAVSLQTALEQRSAGLGGSGANGLFGAGGALDNALTASSGAAASQHSMSGEIAYGVALRYFGRNGASRAALLTPYGRFDLADTDTRWAAGLRFTGARSGLKLGLEAGMDLGTGASTTGRGYDLLLTGSLPF